MGNIWQDLSYGLRMLLKRPGFTLIAAITLALGIGLNAALFSVVNALILRPLPYREASQLVQLWQHDRRKGVAETPVSNADFLAWRAQARSFASLTAHNVRLTPLSTGDGTIEVSGVFVASNFFATLGARPLLGRTFTPEEEQPNRSSVVIVSHQFWQSRLGGRIDAIGESITLDERPHTVVGILRSDYRHPEVFFDRAAEIFLPLPLRPDDRRHALRVIGRLHAGVTPDQAQAEMTAIAGRLEQAYPQSNTDWGAYVVPLAQQHSSKVRRALFLLQGAVGFVLLITCVNLANLLLARVAAREKELAIRAALGAGKLRLIRLFLTESFWLAVLGGLGGLLLALWFVELLPAFAPREITNLGEVHIDRHVLGFALSLSLLAMFFFSLAPLWHVSRTSINEVLKDTPSAPRGKGLRNLLVIAEVALTMVLLSGAGLMLRSLLHLQNVPLGFKPENLMMMQASLPRSVPDPKIVSVYQQMLAQIEALPGVQSVALTSYVPLSQFLNTRTEFRIEGQPAPAPNKLPLIGLRFISPNYFRTMSIPLVAGRAFTEADVSTAPQVAIVNEAFVRKYLSGIAPVGQKLLLGTTPDEIVGVVRDFRDENLQTEAEPKIYIPHAQNGWGTMALVVRTRVQPESLAADLQRAVWQVEKNAVLSRVMTMNDLLSDATARTRFILSMLGVFALVALLLSGVGVYGVMAYTVAQSTREIGIRMALGAETRDMLKLVLGQGLLLALTGVAIGLAGALSLTRLLKTLLYDVSATDPVTFALIALLLMFVALLACWIPARRATKVDPIRALRCE
jgi:putative ABC transport system permease protein